MNSSSRLSSLSELRLQPLYPFRPSSEDNAELFCAEAPANNAGRLLISSMEATNVYASPHRGRSRANE
jgi:hypothetical protein